MRRNKLIYKILIIIGASIFLLSLFAPSSKGNKTSSKHENISVPSVSGNTISTREPETVFADTTEGDGDLIVDSEDIANSDLSSEYN